MDDRLPTPPLSIEELAARVLEGTLSDDEYRQVMARLQVDADERHRYTEYLQLHALLRRELQGGAFPNQLGGVASADRGMAGAPHATTRPQQKWWIRRSHWLFAGTLAATVAVALFLWQVAARFQEVDRLPAPSGGAPIAYLSVATGCDWGGHNVPTGNADNAWSSGQELVLLEGIAEFRLASGVSMSVQGPAALVLHSPTSVTLDYGRVTCHVPWIVTDFAVDVAGIDVRACDAEIGVSVGDAEVAVHCFSGAAEAIPPAVESPDGVAHDERGGAIEIAAKQSIRFSKTDAAKAIASAPFAEADESQFATRLLMSDLLPVTPEYVAEVLRSEPFGYWRFEQLEQGKVANEIDGGEPLEVHGTLRLSGTHDNRFGEFGRPGDESYLMSPHPLTIGGRLDYSFECWVKPSHQHRGGVLALIAGLPPGKPAAHGFYLELQGGDLAGVYSQDYPESVRFLHRNPPSHLFRQGTSCFSNHPYTLRRWQHVVATKQGPDMKLYVNGEVVAEGSDPTPLAEGLRLLVGRAGHANNAMPFVGQLDEIAIFDRALTKQEIDRRHELMWESKKRSGDPKREI